MPKFTFIGSNASGYINIARKGDSVPYRFESGKAVDVDAADEDLIRRLKTNPEFKAGKAKAEKVEDDLPSLTGLNKERLLEVAEAEGVKVEDGATNNEITAAIEAAREA